MRNGRKELLDQARQTMETAAGIGERLKAKSSRYKEITAAFGLNPDHYIAELEAFTFLLYDTLRVTLAILVDDEIGGTEAGGIGGQVGPAEPKQ